MIQAKDLITERKPTWCPGCGNFGILTALRAGIALAGLDPKDTVIVSGIGCSSKIPHYVKTYGFEGIHGRILPVATGIKLANNRLAVIGSGGDGDGYGIGMGHFMHAMRRNLDITYIVHNNQIYGLTKGQYSPTSDQGFKTKSSLLGSIEPPVNPITLAIIGGATFVSRGFVGKLEHLKSLVAQAIKHKGFSLVDILQPCVTFNYKNTYQWYSQRVYMLEEDGYKPDDRMKALTKGEEWGDKIPLGVFYQVQKPTYEDNLPQIKDVPLVFQKIEDVDIRKVMEEFV